MGFETYTHTVLGLIKFRGMEMFHLRCRLPSFLVLVHRHAAGAQVNNHQQASNNRQSLKNEEKVREKRLRAS